MNIILGILVAILTFATVYIAAICEYRWYKILISVFFSIIVSVLVTTNLMGF